MNDSARTPNDRGGSADRNRLWHFHGGLRLPGHKDISTRRPVTRLTMPQRLILPLQQHIGEPAVAVVQAGDRVLKGQLLARPQGYVSAPVHAPSSGTVLEIADHPIAHPSGLSAPCIVLETDGADAWVDDPPGPLDWHSVRPELIRERIRDAGIVGLGGAAFPASVKINTGPDRPIHTLILNGAECEPYISCDDMLMRGEAGRILTGGRILKHLLGAKRLLIGIENNKTEARDAMAAAVSGCGDSALEVVEVPTIYPAGGEKQLIKTLTGLEVPKHGLPSQIGIICQNVGTAAAVADAVVRGRPLISRLVTVTGEGIALPQNVETPVGTPISDLVAHCGGYTDSATQLIVGGPMMGFNLRSDSSPVVKSTNCILVPGRSELPEPAAAAACIRCGECARVCPANLLPQQLYWYARAKNMDKIQDYNLFDCIECGCCAYICPSHIPLVQYYRYAKTEIWSDERNRRKSDIARARHEARAERLERLKTEQEEQRRKKRAALKERSGTDDAAKKAAIEAALRRVEAKKAARAALPPSEAAPAKPRGPVRGTDQTG